jgi:hypothetical protein
MFSSALAKIPSSSEAARMILGRLVCVSRPEKGDTIGTIASFENLQFVVKYEDGDPENFTGEEISKLLVTSFLGKRVRKYFRKHGTFGGTVVSFDDDSFYSVKYDDGDVEAYSESALQRLLICSQWQKDGCIANSLFTVGESVIAFQENFFEATILGKQVSILSLHYTINK